MRLAYRISRQITMWGAVLACDVRAFGVGRVPRSGPVLLASNHQSFLDPMLMTYPLPRECHYMARDTLFTNPLFGRLIRFHNAFPIKRSSADMTGVKETLRRLKTGALVLTFPEGTRSGDGRVGPFHPGVCTIARKAGVPVVPAAIEGAHDAWPRDRKLPRRARIWIEYGRPVDAAADRDPREAAAELTERVRALHNGLRIRAGRPPFDYGERVPHPL